MKFPSFEWNYHFFFPLEDFHGWFRMRKWKMVKQITFWDFKALLTSIKETSLIFVVCIQQVFYNIRNQPLRLNRNSPNIHLNKIFKTLLGTPRLLHFRIRYLPSTAHRGGLTSSFSIMHWNSFHWLLTAQCTNAIIFAGQTF